MTDELLTVSLAELAEALCGRYDAKNPAHTRDERTGTCPFHHSMARDLIHRVMDARTALEEEG